MNHYFYNKSSLNLKSVIGFFTLCNNCFVNFCCFRGTNLFPIDIGFKYTINKVLLDSMPNISVKIVNLQSLFDDLNLYFVNPSNSFNSKNYIDILKVGFRHKCFLPGKILNPVNKGFSVGIFGRICFLAKRYFVSHKISSLFQINKFNYSNNKLKLSQKQVLTLTNRLDLALQIKYFNYSKSKPTKN